MTISKIQLGKVLTGVDPMPILLFGLVIRRKPAVRTILVKLGDSFSVM